MTILHCGLYGDGSSYFTRLLSMNRLDLWIPARKGAMLLMQILPYVLTRIGVRDFKTLAYAFSLSLFIWVSLLIMMSLRICWKSGDRRLMDHTLILWSISLPLTGLYSIHEALPALAAMWLIFVCIRNWIMWEDIRDGLFCSSSSSAMHCLACMNLWPL